MLKEEIFLRSYINVIDLTLVIKGRQFADHNRLLFPQSSYVTEKSKPRKFLIKHFGKNMSWQNLPFRRLHFYG